MKMLFAIILLTCSVNAPSQILKRIKDKAVNKAKENTVDRARNEAREAYYKKMNDKSASDFDKEYSEKMVKDHKNAVDLFEKAANDGNDSDIKAWASNTLPTLRKHLEHAEMCKKESDNK